MDAEYTLHSPFDISLHRQPGLNLEVMIAPDGSIRYAVPSHQEFLIDAACTSFNIPREILVRIIPPIYRADYMRWLIMWCGYVPVWPANLLAQTPTHAQLLTLKSLKMAGLYRGPIPRYTRARPTIPYSKAAEEGAGMRFSEAEEANIMEILREGEEREIVCDHAVREAWFHSRDYGAELRVQFMGQYWLTISRVCLKRERRGTMSRVLEVLREFCEREGVGGLVVQAVQTPAMMNWCTKHGFRPIANATFELNGMIYGDYGLETRPVVPTDTGIL